MALTLVSGRMLANGSVTAEKLDGGAIATSNIAANSVNSVAIVDRSIQANNIGLYVIEANNIANGVISGGSVAANTITALEIKPSTLTANLFSSDSIETAAIADLNITAPKMANTLAVMNVTQMNTSVQNVVVFNSTHIALGNVAGAATINTQQGTYFSANTSGGCTWTFTGGPDSSKATGFTLELTSGAGNTSTAYTQTWPAAVKWPGGTAPTLTQGDTAVDVLIFLTDDGGTNWRGALSIANSA
tara:strand:+ start:280 stop:1017 length:738 start_codon:yes stop_codon:yes gene_type:complete